MSEKIVQLNEEVIKGQLKELVRGSVEETLNELLEQEAEKLTQAARYERNEARQGYRSGHYDRNLTTTSGDVTLHMPRLKGVSFETAIIERYRRRESSVEEALIEMYLAGVSVRRVEDITGADQVYIACGYTDLRKGIDGLARLVQQQFELDPFTNTLFLFCGRRRDRIKGLYWEKDGFILLYKRLEQGAYQWPRSESEVKTLTPQQYRWLMEGLQIEQPKAHRPVT